MDSSFGIVVIGRNVGALLGDSLRSAQAQSARLVYVDSGSTDDSVARARGMGVPVVVLDKSQPYSAARGRNAGAEFLLRAHPALEYLQFLDGDCILAKGFISQALEIMRFAPRIAAVGGQRRERFPEASIYQHLAEIEWESPIGEIRYFGGDVLLRVKAFQQVGGYDERWTAGEDPEMSLRLRRAGWKLWGIPADMTYHDARMTRLAQWWERSVRTGFVYANGAWEHGRGPERHWVRESASVWFWGAGVWTAALGLAKLSRGASLGLLLGYPLLAARIYKRSRARGLRASDARVYALFCILGKFPQLWGQLKFLGERIRRKE